ncbi:MAG TPA: CBS domain-containing protein [Actinomycetota bacterium]|jgi:CBS domain-containing protein|nr:CBS domain-containing protein [Actinomycetota bacterium]
MKVDSLYSPMTVTASPRESLAEVASRMRFNDVGSAAILDHGNVVGIITERDLTRAMADGADIDTATVADYMTVDPVVVAPEQDAREAAWMMTQMGVRHLPVVEAGKLIGLLSVRDVLVELFSAQKSA